MLGVPPTAAPCLLFWEACCGGGGAEAHRSKGAWEPLPTPGHQQGQAEEAPLVLPTPPLSLDFEPNLTDFLLRTWTVLRSPHKHYPSLLTLAPFLS